jgi:hypothetical protein
MLMLATVVALGRVVISRQSLCPCVGPRAFFEAWGRTSAKKGLPRVEPVEYEIELERTNGPVEHTSARLPSLTKGQRLKVPVEGGLVYAEVIEVTRVMTEPVKWKLLARELEPPAQGPIPIDKLN